MPELDSAAHAAAYQGVRERVTALVRSAAPSELEAIAPATPAWRARDVFAHLVGVATDVVNGNVADAAADHWTAAQVEARSEWPVDDLVDEWAGTAAQIDAIILALPTSVTGQLVADAVTHEHDLRHAFGRPGARGSDALTIGVAWVIDVPSPRSRPTSGSLRPGPSASSCSRCSPRARSRSGRRRRARLLEVL